MRSTAQTPNELAVALQLRGTSDATMSAVRTAIDTATELHPSQFRASGRPFLCHLIGTASVVAAHDGQEACISAAVLHAAYSHGSFPDGTSGMTSTHRRWLALRVGDDIEALVAAYHRFSPSESNLRSFAIRPVPVGDHDRTMLLLRAANEIDDHLDGECSSTAKGRGWLQSAAGVEALADASSFCGLESIACSLRAAHDSASTTASPSAFVRANDRSFSIPTPVSNLGDVPWTRLVAATGRDVRGAMQRIHSTVALRTRLRQLIRNRSTQ